MPLSDPIYLNEYASGAPGTDTLVSPSVTVTNGDLVVIIGISWDGAYPTTITQGFSATSWSYGPDNSTTYGTNTVSLYWAYCQVTASGSGTITVTQSASEANRAFYHIYRVPTGFDTSTPIRQYKIYSQTDPITQNTNIEGTFDSAPLITSGLLSMGIATAANFGIGPLSGWSVGHESFGGNVPGTSFTDSNSNSTTFGAQLLYGDYTDIAVVLGLEIQEASINEPLNPKNLKSAGTKLIG